jgi:hypothetical protein
MKWKKAVCLLGAVLLCTGVLMADTQQKAPLQSDPAQLMNPMGAGQWVPPPETSGRPQSDPAQFVKGVDGVRGGQECPPDSLYAQRPHDPNDPWAAFTSAVTTSFNYLVYENFSGVTGQICDVHWWGLSLLWDSGWYECDPTGMTFNITFYLDNGGMPGAAVCTYTNVTPGVTAVGSWSGYQLYYWEVALDPCCSLDGGWVSIQSQMNANDCAFLWMSSPEGDGDSLQEYITGGTPPASTYIDMAFCLTLGEGGPQCPPDSLFGQVPHMPEDYWSFATSAVTTQFTYLVQENFDGVDSPICDIHWWGLSLLYDLGWYACDPAGVTFDIVFYPDVGGVPGAPICTYTGLTPTYVGTGLFYAGFEMYYYTVEVLNPCCVLQNGWVSIQSQMNSNDCAFLWASSPQGNGDSLQDGASTFYDRAVCLTPGGGPDFTVTAPYTSPARNTCGAGDDCNLFYGEDHEYQVTIPYASTWSFNTCLDTSWDTYIFLGTSLCTQDLGSNDDACGNGLQSEIIATLPAGTYYCTVDGFGCGQYVFQVYDTLAGGNDDCQNATPIGDVVDLPFDTTNATFDGPGWCMTSPNIWYCYTATCTGMLSVDTCGSLYDTMIAVYDGCDCDPIGPMLCCNDDACCDGDWTLQSRCNVWVEAGRQYLIEVGGYYINVGPGDLTVQCHPADYYFDGVMWQGGGNGWPYPDGQGEWIQYPGWINQWWPNEFDLERQKLVRIEFDVDFPCYPGDGWLEVVINWSTPNWTDPAAPPFDDTYIARAPDPPIYITDSGHYEFEMMLPYCPAWVSMDVWGNLFVISGTIYHECLGGGVPNDDCVNATQIGDVLDLPFDTTNATFDGNGDCMSSPNIWYCYTATCTGMLSVDTCGSLYDTMIAVYDGCDCYPTYDQMLCCNDDHCCDGTWSLQSRCNVWVEEGRQYLIEVGGYYTNVGPGDLTVRCQPCEYFFDGYTWQGGGNGWPYPEAPGEWIYYPSDWWNMWWPNEFDLNRQKLVRIEFDVEFPCEPGYGWLEVVINWSTREWTDPAAPPFDDVYIERAPDPPLYFMDPGHYEFEMMLPYCPAWVSMDVRGYDYVISGTIYHECLTQGPANDDCVNATPIGDVVDLPFDTTYATFDGPGYCQTAPNVWYCYTATCTGMLEVDTCGSLYDTKIAVYDGCECDPIGPMLCCNDDDCCEGGYSVQSRCTVWVEAGRQYLIEVGGYYTYVGPGDLTVQCHPADYFFNGGFSQGGGNGWPYPEAPGEWIYYPSGWWNMWWPNEFDPERVKVLYIEFDVDFPCYEDIPYGWLEVVVNWSTRQWDNPYEPPLDDVFIERAPDPPIYITEPGHYQLQVIVPYCPWWVSVDVRGDYFVLSGGIRHECVCFGDLDGDNCVRLSDLAQLLSNYGCASGCNYWDGDLDGDGDVDLSDLAALLSRYGMCCP